MRGNKSKKVDQTQEKLAAAKIKMRGSFMEHCNVQNLGSKQGFRNSVQQSMFNTSKMNKTGTLLLHPSAAAFIDTGKSIQIGEKRVNHFLTQHSNASLADKSIQYSEFNRPEPILPDYISKSDF